MSVQLTVTVNGNTWADREVSDEEVQLYKSLGIDLTRTAPEPTPKASKAESALQDYINKVNESVKESVHEIWKRPVEEHLKASAQALENQVKEQEKDHKGRTPAQVSRDQEREAVTRAVHIVEQTIRKLPTSASGIAGFLQGLGYKGNQTSTGNALAVYLTDRIKEGLSYTEFARLGKTPTVYADQNAIIVETPIFQMCIDIPYHVRFVVSGINSGRWPAIVTGV